MSSRCEDRSRALKAFAGSAPVTKASGRSISVTHRRVKNNRLAAVGFVWAFVAAGRDGPGRDHYLARRRYLSLCDPGFVSLKAGLSESNSHVNMSGSSSINGSHSAASNPNSLNESRSAPTAVGTPGRPGAVPRSPRRPCTSSSSEYTRPWRPRTSSLTRPWGMVPIAIFGRSTKDGPGIAMNVKDWVRDVLQEAMWRRASAGP